MCSCLFIFADESEGKETKEKRCKAEGRRCMYYVIDYSMMIITLSVFYWGRGGIHSIN